ncbi:alpha/beta fold hydrolase BchO [Gemmatimonas sp.]|jgi:magnesium chelatase accessory protein|uniref:alpha/beta fold hydrolase BchO n=3 Tax=Gemmatimonas sp. TaxID=1962908 RepID=UPI0037C00E0C
MRQEKFTPLRRIFMDTSPDHVPKTPPNDWPDVSWSESHFVTGIFWHIQRLGMPRGEAPTLLLVHGTGGSTHSWAGVTPVLAARFHILNVDLPGHGFTAVPADVERVRNPFTLPGMARELAALLTHLDEHPDLVVGHSAGVPVLLRMALDGTLVPQRIIGCCPALVPPPDWYVALLAPLVGLLVESQAVAGSAARLAATTPILKRMLESTGSPLTPAQLSRYMHLCSRPAHVHAAITMMSRWDLPSLFRDIGVLRVPVQLIAARNDRWIPLTSLRRALERIPGVELVVEEGGHLLPEERPEVVIRLLQDRRL